MITFLTFYHLGQKKAHAKLSSTSQNVHQIWKIRSFSESTLENQKIRLFWKFISIVIQFWAKFVQKIKFQNHAKKNQNFQSLNCECSKRYALCIFNLQKDLISPFFHVDSENDLIFQIRWRTWLKKPKITWVVSCLES
jgi:hypothetical protein